ncbi:hypothetical protein FRC01_009104 [Tulasnella sp. 417]|nr:hypothetical protein FRC01_009104 [Tulasnella sp. 417]
MSPKVGSRLALGAHRCTVRYIGPVPPFQGEWLGVEWDDPSRGKHDGTKDGIRYFSCIAPGTPGSFIRDSPALSQGTTFLAALAQKYMDFNQAPNGQVDTVVLGSSGGAIVVEAPRLTGVRQRLARLDALRVVSLDDELVSNPGEPDEIRSKDLSK